MGWDPIFKVKHNLDTSSDVALARDLERKLKCKAIIYLDSYTIELADELGIDVEIYKHSPEIRSCDHFTMFVTDDLFIPHRLLMMYGEKAQDILINFSDEQYMINEIEEVRNGAIRYNIEYGSEGSMNKDEIWHICAETLSGSPNYPGRWSLFRFLFEKDDPHNSELWQDFIECRKSLYDYLCPIIKELPVYYHADQGDMELLDEVDQIEEFERAMVKYELETFNPTLPLNRKKHHFFGYYLF